MTRDLDKVVTGSCSTQLILSQPTPWVVKLILLINLFFMKETSVKLVFWVLLDIALGIFIIGATFGVGAILRASNAVAPSRTITVSGEGKISVAPDLATAGFSVVTQGTDPAAIQKENSEKINKTVAFLKSKGIEAKDITTTNYNLYPRYKYNQEDGQSGIIGYELNQTVTVKLRDLEKVGEIVGGLTSAGVNQISQLSFSIEDPEASKNRARLDAFNQARSKAEAMAAANGVRIARVINFSESGGPYPIPYYERSYLAGKGGDGAVAPDIQPGEQELNVQVTVTYEIK